MEPPLFRLPVRLVSTEMPAELSPFTVMMPVDSLTMSLVKSPGPITRMP